MVKTMKKILIFCILTVIILIVFPLVNTQIPQNAPVSNVISAKAPERTKSDKDMSKQEKVLSLALDYVDDSYCDEGLKAVMCILENNCIFESENNIHKDITATREYSDEFYQRLEKLYKDTNAELKFKEKRVYVPLSELSAGYTAYCEDYPYIIRVASPWDCMQENFVYDKEYAPGISTKGLDKLCSDGATYTEALRWYLPLLDIKT